MKLLYFNIIMLYFVRHGESEANREGVFAGQRNDSPLTLRGREQARLAGRAIITRGISIDRIIASPLLRARETAKIIARVIRFEGGVATDPRLMEYDMGSLSFEPIREITPLELVSAEGAEDPQVFLERAVAAVREAATHDEATPGNNTLLVSHGGIYDILHIARTKGDPRLFFRAADRDNGEVIALPWPLIS